MTPMPLPADVHFLIDTLAGFGHRADVVGGSVRDFLRGLPPHDFDMATDATPEEMKRAFASCRVIETGIRHGTLTVLRGGTPYEITTYRVDGDYADHRHPDGVSFTRDLTADLARRDFTVNAIAYHPTYGYTDPFGGREDIAARRLRAVGDPRRRFEEDALRILRALRFSATLDFEIEEKTAEALRAAAPTLSAVSVERVDAEWQKWMAGTAAAGTLARFADLLPHFFPELADSPAVRTLPADCPPNLRTWYLFAPFSDAVSRYDSAMRRLHADNRRRLSGIAVLSHLDAPVDTDAALLALLAEIGEENTDCLLALRTVRGEGAAAYARTRLTALLDAHAPYRVADLAVGGEELAARGFRKKEIGHTLGYLIEEVRRGNLKNEKEALLAAARKRRSEGEEQRENK